MSSGQGEAWRVLGWPPRLCLAGHGPCQSTGSPAARATHPPPGRTSCDLPLETSVALESPGKEGQSQGSSRGRGDTGPVSPPLAPQPEAPRQVETALTACGCRMWFWNFPTPPAIGCPAPRTLPQAQIGHVGRLSSYPLHPRGGGGWWSGGLSLGHLCGASLNPPCPEALGESWVQSFRRRLCREGLALTLLPPAPHLWTPPQKDREPRQRGKPTAQP